MNETPELKVTYALVLRGGLTGVNIVVSGLQTLLRNNPDVKVVHQITSAGKLWIKEGED